VPFTKSADAVVKFRLAVGVATGAIQAVADTMQAQHDNLMAISQPGRWAGKAGPKPPPPGFVDQIVGEFL
jgi:hypothetical protein